MKLIVFGASGGTGNAAVLGALARGHEVTACVRRANAARVDRARVRVVEANALDGPRVRQVLKGHDAVLSFLGARPWRFTDVCSRGIANIVAGMSEHGICRLVAFPRSGLVIRRSSSIGVLGSPRSPPDPSRGGGGSPRSAPARSTAKSRPEAPCCALRVDTHCSSTCVVIDPVTPSAARAVFSPAGATSSQRRGGGCSVRGQRHSQKLLRRTLVDVRSGEPG